MPTHLPPFPLCAPLHQPLCPVILPRPLGHIAAPSCRRSTRVTWVACRGIDLQSGCPGSESQLQCSWLCDLGQLTFLPELLGLIRKREIWLLYVPLKGFNVMPCLQYTVPSRDSGNLVVCQALNSVFLPFPTSTSKIPAPMPVFHDF